MALACSIFTYFMTFASIGMVAYWLVGGCVPKKAKEASLSEALFASLTAYHIHHYSGGTGSAKISSVVGPAGAIMTNENSEEFAEVSDLPLSLQNAPEGWPTKFCHVETFNGSDCPVAYTKVWVAGGNDDPTLREISCAAGLSADWSGDNMGSWEVWNWHPLLMTIAYGAMAAQAIISFRVLPFSKPKKKAIHVLSHVVAVCCSTLAIIVVFLFKKSHDLDNMYTVHSWIGGLAYCLYGFQFLLGFFFFLFPRPSESIRAAFLPYHTYWGQVIFVAVTVALITGLLDRLTITSLEGACDSYSVWNMAGNACAVIILITAWSALWHTQQPKPKENSEDYSYAVINNPVGGFDYS